MYHQFSYILSIVKLKEERAMDMTLAREGLPEISFSGMAKTETIGSKKADVAIVVKELYEQADKMSQFADELVNTQAELSKNWDATTAGSLDKLFPKIIQTFKSCKPALESIANWAKETNDKYVEEDNNATQLIDKILGGVQ